VVNGEKNGLNIHLANTGKKNYTLISASSSFHDPLNHWALVSCCRQAVDPSCASWILDKKC